MNMSHFSAGLLGATLVAMSCGGQEPNISVAPTAPVQPTRSGPPRSPMTFELAGIVTDQDGSSVRAPKSP